MIANLIGWRRLALAGLLGAATILALPPVGWWPLLLPGFMGLLWLLDGARSLRQAFWTGWAFGFGYHLVGLYWISNAMLVAIDLFWWLIPFASVGLPLLLGVFPGASLALAKLLGAAGHRPNGWRAGVLALCWMLGEYAQGHLLTGFPWNLLGYAWVDTPIVAQTAAWAGVYGLGLITLLVILPIGVAVAGGRLRGLIGAGLAALVVLGYGWLRLDNAQPALVPDLTIRLVQPNVDVADGFDPVKRYSITRVERLVAMSRRAPKPQNLRMILWPEGVVPYALEVDGYSRKLIATAVPQGGVVITGADRFRWPGKPLKGPPVEIWNGVSVLDAQGEIIGRYDKVHLVPFGEYVPFSWLLPVETIAGTGLPFSPGLKLASLPLPGLPMVGPLVCYEIIFPGAVVDPAQRPDWLLNVTNDGWFGESFGPYQHFAMARLRAVEQGLPVVVVANTGVSGVIDPWGRVQVESALGQEAVIDAPLPMAIAPPPYGRFGDFPLLLLVGMGLILGGVRRIRRGGSGAGRAANPVVAQPESRIMD